MTDSCENKKEKKNLFESEHRERERKSEKKKFMKNISTQTAQKKVATKLRANVNCSSTYSLH